MPKRRSGDVEAPQEHLYIVVDDWLRGYSIRKLDLRQPVGTGISGEGSIDCTDHLKDEIVLRLEALRGSPVHFTAAFDSKIMVLHPREIDDTTSTSIYPLSKRQVPVVDVMERSLTFGPRPKADLVEPVFIHVGDALFSLTAVSFELLHPPPIYKPDLFWEWSWAKLPKPPIDSKHVTSYAVHPDERTIFISIQKDNTTATLTFDSKRVLWDAFKKKKMEKAQEEKEQEYKRENEEEDEDDDDFYYDDDDDDEEEEEEEVVLDGEGSGWKQHGEWVLPFTGCAYYDRHLDAWVGLSRDPECFGRLCSCDVAPANSTAADEQCRSPKVSRESLFNEDPKDKHIGATLLYLGNRSNFCLVESIIKGGCDLNESDFESQLMEKGSTCMFRLTTFWLQYDKNGCLTTGDSRQVKYYKVPPAVSQSVLKNPVAFWI